MTPATLQASVLRAMPPAPAELTARQIHTRVGQGSFRSLKAALGELILARQVVRGGEQDSPTYMRRASGRSAIVKQLYNPTQKARLAPWISAA